MLAQGVESPGERRGSTEQRTRRNQMISRTPRNEPTCSSYNHVDYVRTCGGGGGDGGGGGGGVGQGKEVGGEKENYIWKRQRCKQNILADLVLVFKYSYASSQADFNGVASRANRTREGM